MQAQRIVCPLHRLFVAFIWTIHGAACSLRSYSPYFVTFWFMKTNGIKGVCE